MDIRQTLMNIEHLYKYGHLNEYSEALFSENRIWFSPPSQLNDPFECRPWFTFDGNQGQILGMLVQVLRLQDPLMTQEAATAEAEAIFLKGHHRDPYTWDVLRMDVIRKLGIEIGLYCLSRIPDSILMWSHYASDHQGYCLEFEATDHTSVFGEAQPVLYSDDHPNVDFFNTPNDKQVDLIFLTKYTGWAYEQEWRIIDFQNGPGLRTYPSQHLTGVIFGLRMPEDDKTRIKEWVGRRGYPVRLSQVVQHDQKFSLEIRDAN